MNDETPTSGDANQPPPAQPLRPPRVRVAPAPRPELRTEAKPPAEGDAPKLAAPQPRPPAKAPPPPPQPAPEAEPKAAGRSAFRIGTLVILLLCIVLFAWYIAADRMTPFTGNARVRAYIVPIVPQVSGYVSDIEVANNSFVEAGDVLFQIDARPYQLAVDAAQAQLELAGQAIGADTASVDSAQARLVQTQSQLENARVQSARIFELERRGYAPAAQADQARSDLAAAEAQVEAAQADLLRAQETLGSGGSDNPRIQAALAALGQARLNLEWTTLRAPARGAVTDLRIDVGSFAQASQPMMTFVSLNDVWLEAFMTENNLGNMRVGDPVEIAFDVQPGRIIEGTVASFAAGAATGREARIGALPEVEQQRGWLRDPQRFPVLINIQGYGDGQIGDLRLRAGSQADVIVYTGDNGLMNLLGGVWIRLVSWLSYVY